MERLDAMLSRGEKVDMKSYAQITGHLRRLWETLGLGRRAKDVNDMRTFLKRKDKHKHAVTVTPAPESELITEAD